MKNPVDAQVSYYGNLSLKRTWSVVGQEKSSAWSAIYAYCTGSTCSIVFVYSCPLSPLVMYYQ